MAENHEMNSSIQRFITRQKAIWYHENDGYYYKQSGIKCGKTILKCVDRSCKVRAVINNNRLIRLNMKPHSHEPDLNRKNLMRNKAASPDRPNKKKACQKKNDRDLENIEITGKIEEFSTERNGKWYHQHDGFYYRKYRERGNKCYIVCVEQNCNVTAVMNGDFKGSILIVNNRVHTHEPDKDRKALMLLRKDILSRCRKEDTSLKEIYDEEVVKVNDRIRARIPFCTFKISMSKSRMFSKNQTGPESLLQLKSILCEKSEHLTLYEKEFLATATDTFAIFISPGTEELLEIKNVIYSIDTIKCLPKRPFVNHVFTLGAIIDDMLVPIVYIFITAQLNNTYKEVFKFIKGRKPTWNPETIICEVDKDLNEIVMQIFPNAVVNSSWYHYNQAVLFKTKKLIFEDTIKENVNLQEIIRMLLVLPLLPANLLKEGLRIVEEEATARKVHLITGVPALFSYMRAYWALKEGVNLYLLSTTILKTVLIHQFFHESIGTYLGDMLNSHPNIWTLIETLKTIEYDFTVKYTNKRNTSISNVEHEICRQRISDTRMRLIHEELSILEFLQEISELTSLVLGLEKKREESLFDLACIKVEECDDEDYDNFIETESIELNYDWETKNDEIE